MGRNLKTFYLTIFCFWNSVEHYLSCISSNYLWAEFGLKVLFSFQREGSVVQDVSE